MQNPFIGKQYISVIIIFVECCIIRVIKFQKLKVKIFYKYLPINWCNLGIVLEIF